MRKIVTLAPALTVAALLGASITGGAGVSAATAAPVVATARPTVITPDGKGARPTAVSPDGKGARAAVISPDGKGPLRLPVRRPACEGLTRFGSLAVC